MAWVGLGLLCYVIGSFPTAYLFTRYILGRDIREIGDFNSGAANVFRNVGSKAGVAVGSIDIIKGSLVIVLTKSLIDNSGMEMMAGAAALVGHNFPVHLKFKGGRGAAAAVGVLIASLPIIGLPIGVAGLVLLYFTRKAIYPGGYSPAWAVYAVAIPISVGISHFFTIRIVNSSSQQKLDTKR